MTKCIDKKHRKTLFIGSSPVLLVEALICSQRGEEVTILEAQDKLGGSWSADTFFGIRMDTGVHFFYKVERMSKREYSWIGNLSDTSFDRMKPTPTGDLRVGLIYPPEYSFSLRPSRGLSAKVKNMIFSLRRNIEAALGHGYLYPRNGCAGWLADIEKSLRKLGVSIKLSSRAEILNVNGNSVRCILTDGKYFDSDKAYVSSRAVIGNITIRGQRYLIRSEPLLLTHCFVRLSDMRERRFSVHKFFNHQKIFAISDMRHTFQAYTNGTYENETVIAFAMNKWIEPTDIDPDELISILRNRGLLEKSARIIDHKIVVNRSTNPDVNDVASLNHAGNGVIEFVHYNNIAKGFSDRIVSNSMMEITK